MLSRWRKEYREGKIVADKRKKLEAENKKLKQELDLLKKWQRFLAEEHQQDIDSSRNSDES